MGRKRRARRVEQLELLTKAGTVRRRRPQTFKRGRKPGRPKVAGSKLRHEQRPDFSARQPLHVTWRMQRGLPNLRSAQAMGALRRAFVQGKDRFGFRLVHFSVQRNHVHLICEAADKKALSRGLKGLAVRVARGLNRTLDRRGRVLGDRYHAQVLSTPTQVRWALGYVLCNTRKHNAQLLTPKRYPRRWLDTYGSSAGYFPGWCAPPRAANASAANATTAATSAASASTAATSPAGASAANGSAANGSAALARDARCGSAVAYRDLDDNSPVARPKTYLIGRGWLRLGKLPTDHVPG